MDVKIALETFTNVLTKHYADFEGRAGRAEFWLFVLVSFCASIACDVLGIIVGTRAIGAIYQLAVLLPTLAVSARRLHDTDRSGWWLLLPVAPLAAGLILIPFAMNSMFGGWYSLSYASPLFDLVVKLVLATAAAYAVLVYWFIQPGSEGANKFGAAALGVST